MSKQCIQRLLREYKQIQQDPPPYIVARPDEENVQVWYYVIKGPPDSPYQGGVYLGKVRFPDEYPFAPPSIMMCTPSGRFKPETRLCFSMSDFHPKEWNPSWGPSSILKGLLSFMLEDTQTYGSMESSTEYKQKMALESHSFNLRHPAFNRMFPNEKDTCEIAIAQQQAAKKSGNGSTTSNNKEDNISKRSDTRTVTPSGGEDGSPKTNVGAKGANLFGRHHSNVLKLLQVVFVLLVAVTMMYAFRSSPTRKSSSVTA